jgi:UDP-N-acetylmuramate--alanine ligase
MRYNIIMNTQTYKKAHFIGIGGIGMSAIAKYLRHNGVQVSGSDRSASEITHDLVMNYQVEFWEGTHEEKIESDTDVIIYSPAVPSDDPEYERGISLGISLLSYPELLGKITANKKTVAIAGTNGKTTTTAMTIEIMKHLGEDPSAIIGALLQKYGTNFIAGQSDYFITEACEYKESFLNINHDVLVITNITEDHLDYFTDISHIQRTFQKFLYNKKESGILVCDTELDNLKPIVAEARNIGMTIINYRIFIDEGITLSLPGNHNIQNAAAALGVISSLGLSIQESKDYLEKYFQGAKRRMENIGITTRGAQIFDDYAHNPEGLKYLIEGLRDFYPEKKIILLFEPHLYSRTREFKHAFAHELEKVDILYLFPTYRAREKELPQEKYLLEQYIDTTKVELVTVVDTKNFKHQFESMNFSQDYIVISAGAGDIWKHSLELKKTL